MNPARWFGPALVTGDMGSALIYLVGPIVGALVAVFVYDLVMKPAKV
jgi:glycerol uptake facilitator-like aquaporin